MSTKVRLGTFLLRMESMMGSEDTDLLEGPNVRLVSASISKRTCAGFGFWDFGIRVSGFRVYELGLRV